MPITVVGGGSSRRVIVWWLPLLLRSVSSTQSQILRSGSREIVARSVLRDGFNGGSQVSTFEGRPGWDTSQDLIPVTNARDRFFEGAAAGATALIVEDDYRNCFALTALLAPGSHRPFAAILSIR
jgi:hypothetical protein